MSGRIAGRFAALRERNEAAMVPFLMAGDPDMETTAALVREAAAAGADLLEIGVPFSDPTADGPTLQRSAARALAAGASLPAVLGMVAELRREIDTPIVVFGYYNPIFRYGPSRFAADAAGAGADGVLVVDLPPEEAAELHEPLRAHGLDAIFLLAPTSDEARVRAVLRRASGFVYYVSMTGVTGAAAIAPRDVRPAVEALRRRCSLPVGVGFGISTAAEAREVAAFADAVIVGSALMRAVEAAAGDRGAARQAVRRLVSDLKAATRR